MTDVLDLVGAERLTSASMFAVEFVDPFTDQPIRFGLRVCADGLGPPIRTISGRYAWNDNKPPANRTISVHVNSVDGRYAEFNDEIDVPAHVPGIAPAKLLFRRPLTATGLYTPPDGATAFAGELVMSGTPPSGLKGVTVHLVLICEDKPFDSEYPAITDSRGGFVAIMRGLGARLPDLVEGRPAGYLRFRHPNKSERFTKAMLPLLQHGRLVYAAGPIRWDNPDHVSPNAPQLPASTNGM